MHKSFWILLATLVLTACIHGGHTGGSRGRHASARINTSESFRQCKARLDLAGVRYTPLPDQTFGGGCDSIASVKLLDIGVPTANLGPMTCPLASNFAAWARYGVQPAARQIFTTELVRIETMGTYSCRKIAGSSRISEHAHANAVDVSAFLLADGRRITVLDGWNGDEASRRFLRVIRGSACKRFRTVLSPEFNVAHSNHLHFDMGGAGGFCR
jgi:hypothetical protein